MPPKKPPASAAKPRDEKYIRIPAGLWDQLAALAEANDRPVNREAARAIREYVARQRTEPEPKAGSAQS